MDNFIHNFIQVLTSPEKKKVLQQYYGESPSVLSQRAGQIVTVLQHFSQSFPGEKPVSVIRVPGRINLMGVHIDHRGGSCNYISIPRETVFCISPRDDDRIIAKNIDGQFQDEEFSICELMPNSMRGDWLKFIDTAECVKGNWINYIQAGALKLQDRFPDKPLRGMNIKVGGDIPPKSGLSSSSTLVVGTILALSKINSLEMDTHEWIELCGEAEWYVGTRGGCGDHASMLLGKRGSVTHTGFYPVQWEHFPFPDGFDVILCQSGIEANKATIARETFNSRIAAYEVALLLYRHHHPDLAERIAHIRDIEPDHLGITFIDFYRRIKAIPIEKTESELEQDHPELRNELSRIFQTYGKPGTVLPIREVLLFGIGECSRSMRFTEYMKNGSIKEAGRLMYLSHDGDRISQWIDGKKHPYRSPYSDTYLDRIANELLDQLTYHTSIENTGEYSLAYQPGGYRCSIEEMDHMVDRCKKIEGVYGAGLTGAGLGGAIVILCRKDTSQTVLQEMRTLLLEWNRNEPFLEICQPVAGASFIDFKI